MVQPLSTPGADVETDALDDDPAIGAEHRIAPVAADGHALRLDKVVVAMAPEFSRSHLQSLIEQGHVRVDGAPSTVSSNALAGTDAAKIVALARDVIRTGGRRGHRPALWDGHAARRIVERLAEQLGA